MRVLGISAFYHDSAAAVVQDGEIVAAAQEERFTRKKHDARFPANAVDYCLREARVSLDDFDYVAFYDKPLLKFERLLETYLSFAPRGFKSFSMAIPVWLREKLFLKDLLTRELKKRGSRKDRRGSTGFFRAPPEPRRQRVLPFAVRRGSGVDHGRRRRVGDHVARAWARESTRGPAGNSLSALPGSALLGVHLLHRVQGQLRRIQGDGPRTIRRAEVRATDPSTTSSI